MKADEIKAKIAKIKSNKYIPENLKPAMLKKLQAQLDEMDEKKPAKKSRAKKAKKSKAAPAKKAKAVTPKLYKGKKLTDLDEADCEQLLADIKARKEAASTSSAKSASKPVVEKIANNLATAVKQVIDDIPKKDIKKAKPKLKAVVSDVKKLMNSIRKVIGDETKQAKVAAIFKELIDLINEK